MVLKELCKCKEFDYKTEVSIHDIASKEPLEINPRILLYLRHGDCLYASPGIFPHPSIPGETQLGQVMLTDGIYCWDILLPEYMKKYSIQLPEEFIEHVMSDRGKRQLRKWMINRRILRERNP